MAESLKMKYQIGMNEVYVPPLYGKDSQIPSANIVFIHGLFGHPWKTWADEGVKGTKKPFWPEDLLPSAVPNARIYSFGYDADVERFMSAAGLNTVHQHGRNLLNDLCDLFDKYDTKIPFIFIVHSLGGLVLKEALNQSSGTENRRTKQVAELTYGVIFLGTPHRGSAVASYGKMAFLLTKVFAGQSANTQLLRALEKNSETLDRISSTFHETLKKYKNIHLFSFFEEKETRKAIFGMRIVPPECARIGHEDWGGIPENHRYMAKFKSDADPGFMKVSNVVKRWIVGIEEDDKRFLLQGYKECLESLDDPSARARVQQVSQQHKNSFEWLFSDEVDFCRWLEDDKNEFSPIFWITGKPGSGKSTLMRFAMQDPRTLKLLPDGFGNPVAYFFHLRGKSRVQKSLNGMLLEITFQVLTQFPEYFLSIKEIYTDLLRVSRNKRLEWSTEILKQCVLLIPLFLQAQKGSLFERWKGSQPEHSRTRLILFIDALDENEDQSENNEVISILKELAEFYSNSIFHPGVGPILKICLASRPWPIFQKQLGDEKRVLSFAIHDHTKEDIHLYCRSRLSSAISERETFKKDVEHWIEIIASKAHGVFIWVRLVVDYLYQNIIDGTPYSHLQAYLTSLPDELSNLYEFTLKRIPKEYALETLVSLRILLASRSLLTLETLYCATISCITSYSVGLPEATKQEQLAWLRSRTGGLIELAPTDLESCVQFVHQTAQEFVIRGLSGLDLISDERHWTQLDGNFFMYKSIAKCHPPFPPLMPLARDIFSYIKSVDRLFEDDASRRAIQRILSNWISLDPPTDFSFFGGLNYRRESILRWIYRWPLKAPHISVADIASYYVAPDKQQIFTDLKNWLDDSGIHMPLLSPLDPAEDLTPLPPRKTVHFVDDAVMPNALWLAFILHGVHHVDYGRSPAHHVPGLLLLTALGPSFIEQDSDRVRLFEKICRPWAGHHLDLNGFRRIPMSVIGRKHRYLMDIETGGLLEALIACEEHPSVDEDTRFHIAQIFLSILPESTRSMMVSRTIRRDMSILDFCARFKSRRWTELLYSYSTDRSPRSLFEYIPLAAAVGKDRVAIRDICYDFATDTELEFETYTTHDGKDWVTSDYRLNCYLLPLMVAALPGSPIAYKAAHGRKEIRWSSPIQRDD